MPARAQQGILGTDHGQEGAMDMVHRLLIAAIQVSRVIVTQERTTSAQIVVTVLEQN